MAGQEAIAVKNYFDVHFKILLFFGVPIEKLTVRFKPLYTIYAICIHLFVNTLYPVLELLGLFLDFNDDSFTFIFSYFISHFLALCKICLIFIFREDITTFCKTLETGRFFPNPQRGGPIENDYVQNAITQSKRQTYFFHIFVVLIVGQRALYGIFDSGQYVEVYDEETYSNITLHIRRKPFICYLPFEANDSPLYEIVSIYQTLCCAFSGFIIGAVDGIICGFMCHIKAQLLILIHSLETFLDRTERLMLEDGLEIDLENFKSPVRLSNGICIVEKLPETAQRYADICIIDSIKHHQEILDLAVHCETTFRWLLLLQVGGSSLLVCMQLYQLSIYQVGSPPFLGMLCYLMLMSVQLVLYCWHGNELKVISDQISEAAFHCNWQVTNLKTQRCILLMIQGSFRPIKMTAGKFIFLSLESCMSLMKGSGSYFMFLKEMNKKTTTQ